MPSIDQYGNILPDEGQEFGGFELGELDLQGFLIQMGLDPPQAAQIAKQLQAGRDPRTEGLVDSGIQQREDLLGADPAFGEAELDQFRSLISGDFFTEEMAGTFRDRVQRANKPFREQQQAALAARGLGTSGGEQAALAGNIAKGEQQTFSEIAAQQFMQAMGLGTQGLATADQLGLQRQQIGANMGSDIRNFLEGSDQARMGIGLNLAGLQQQGALQTLQMNEGLRSQRRADKMTFGDAIGAGLQFAAPFFPPAAGAAAGMNIFGGSGDIPGSQLPGQPLPNFGFA